MTRQPAIANNLARDTLGRLHPAEPQGGGGQNANPLYSFENALRDDISSRFIGGATVNSPPLNWLTFS